MTHDEAYWTARYRENQTQWDAGQITTPLKQYIDQLTDKHQLLLIPGCGFALEAVFLHKIVLKNFHLFDIAEYPLAVFLKKNPSFPSSHLIHNDFFNLDVKFDLIIEQTFFCALHPSQRSIYCQKMKDLLTRSGRLIGVLFEDELFSDHPPYGGDRVEYIQHFEPYFEFKVFERCYNSIKPRENRELFINLLPKF